MNVLSLPAIYSLEITPACNNRCPGCSNVYTAEHGSPAAMSAQAWRRLLLPFIGEAVQIRLTGGEPTLHPEFLQLFDEVTAHDAQVTVFTNGRWAEPETLLQHVRGRPNFSGFLISLHGADASRHEAFSGVKGSFGEALGNVRRAVDAGVPVALSTVITRYNWDALEDVAELAQRLGAHHVAYNRYIGAPLPAIEPTDEQNRAAVRQIQALVQAGAAVKYGVGVPQCFVRNASEGCLAGVAYVSIDPWGGLRPCAHSATVVGSLLESTLAELWQGPAMAAWRGLMPRECRGCATYSACHGGCRAIQELRADGRDPLRELPLKGLAAAGEVQQLPALGKPRLAARLRPEAFGYVLLGRGQVLPVRPEARALLEACTGDMTFAELAEASLKFSSACLSPGFRSGWNCKASFL
jgi:AdoMet-dependent heme synthase